MDPLNENAPASDRGARKNDRMQGSEPHSQAPSNSKDLENRRNSAGCFRNRDKREDWYADYLGVTVVEDLPTGSKVWVNVRERKTRKGETYLTVSLKPFRAK
jgi:hypothetical protein